MTWMTKSVVVAVATAGGAIALRCIPRESRYRVTRAIGDWMSKKMADHMGRVMASLPEGAPPKLVMSVLPKLQAQSEQIIAMLREQNELLRQQRQRATGATIDA
jgi:hypothetical protein